MEEERKVIVCSFCGRMEKEGENFITGSLGGAICRECVELCEEIVRLGKDQLEAEILSPERIKEMIEAQAEGKLTVTEPGIGYWTKRDNRITTKGTTVQISQ
ncbi:hypothetical protein J7M22_08020 [Candidatus Poribacteria bacterium]|nr:hypothetical protein [Candidatus Poribacteria bacterium]